MPVKHTPTPAPKNKGKKASAHSIDYEAKLDRDDSGNEELTIVGEFNGMPLLLATWQND